MPLHSVVVALSESALPSAGRDGFWLARWLEGYGIEPHVIHASSIPVKREQRRAKTDRQDCRLLMRAYVDWLRGEAEHCRMVAVPSIEAEDAKTPNRERAARSWECTRVINRMKSTLARLGIRGFKPDLKKAVSKLDDLRLPTGEALPPHARAELRRDMALFRVLREQIEEIKDARDTRLAEAPDETPHASWMLFMPLYIPCRPNRIPIYSEDIRRLFLPIPSSTTSNTVALSRTRSYARCVSLSPSILSGVTPVSPFSKRSASATDASSQKPPGSRRSGIRQA